ncbi:hypothetical protein SKAU_G00201160 [Synaphobranchus kaupii]|uniref:Secreted protein n=1 Tax=Synaphobranchus kaupii TaxID=118154 RepID=A0A9Q1IW43_SYNKA|nr:hypothetical protein SKAU_G00201160 [Synaphobranchus kaupii]
MLIILLLCPRLIAVATQQTYSMALREAIMPTRRMGSAGPREGGVCQGRQFTPRGTLTMTHNETIKVHRRPVREPSLRFVTEQLC